MKRIRVRRKNVFKKPPKMFSKTAKIVSKTAKSVNSFQSFPSITGTLEKVILQSPKGLSATVLKRVDMVAFRLQTYEV